MNDRNEAFVDSSFNPANCRTRQVLTSIVLLASLVWSGCGTCGSSCFLSQNKTPVIQSPAPIVTNALPSTVEPPPTSSGTPPAVNPVTPSP